MKQKIQWHMKQKIQWHKDCLKNSEIFLSDKRKEMQRLAEEIRYLETYIANYREQIAEAEKQGKDSFDSEKFFIKKN